MDRSAEGKVQTSAKPPTLVALMGQSYRGAGVCCMFCKPGRTFAKWKCIFWLRWYKEGHDSWETPC